MLAVKAVVLLMFVSSLSRGSRSAERALLNQLYLYSKDNIAMVHIFIKDPFVTKLKRDEAFSIILFVAGAGGTQVVDLGIKCLPVLHRL